MREPTRIAILGPSDMEVFKVFKIMDTSALSEEIAEGCRLLKQCTRSPIVAIVPYKGLPVEVARSYQAIIRCRIPEKKTLVHGLWDDSLSKSKTFAKNKAVCTSLFKCPDSIPIQRFLVNYVDTLLVMGISHGTLKELLENNIVKKQVFLHSKFVTVLPMELQACFNIQVFDDWITFVRQINNG